MGFREVQHVLDNSQHKGAALLVLVCLADWSVNGSCWGTLETIATRARITVKTARACLETLADSGELTIETGKGKLIAARQGRAIHYTDRFTIAGEVGKFSPNVRSEEIGAAKLGNRRREVGKSAPPIVSRTSSTSHSEKTGRKTTSNKIHRRERARAGSVDKTEPQIISQIVAMANADLLQPLIFAGISLPSVDVLAEAITQQIDQRDYSIVITPKLAQVAAARALAVWIKPARTRGTK